MERRGVESGMSSSGVVLGKQGYLFFKCTDCGGCFFTPRLEKARGSWKWSGYSFVLLMVCRDCGQIHKWRIQPYSNQGEGK